MDCECCCSGCQFRRLEKFRYVLGYIMQKFKIPTESAINVLISANIKHSEIWGRPVGNIVSLNFDLEYDELKLSDSDIGIIQETIDTQPKLCYI